MNNGDTTWTYNQGVILGGLAALHELTGDEAYLRQGEAIADAALRSLTSPRGILAEPGEVKTAADDRDRPQFKGIFVRYLQDFSRCAGKPEYGSFLLANADSVWTHPEHARPTPFRPAPFRPAPFRPAPFRFALGGPIQPGQPRPARHPP